MGEARPEGILSGQPLMILCEPASWLGGGNMEVMASMLRDEAERGCSILVIIQDRELITGSCSRVYDIS